MTSESIFQQYEHYVLGTYRRFPLIIERGQGSEVWDIEGKRYVDFGAGIAVCSLGHAHPEITRAIAEQAAKLVHTSNLYYTLPQAQLAQRLVELVGEPGKIFFCNSGAEANEGLIKLARKFGNATGRYEIITFEQSFHGRTMAGISATAQQKVKTGFAPLLEGFRHVPWGDLKALRAAIDKKTAAILLEPIQGEGGIHIADPQFLCNLRALCDEHQLLLLFDEIQCGLGRTGDWCGWKSLAGDRVMPDGISWAKGIANGFPLGAFWVRDHHQSSDTGLHELLGPGSHGTTYGGNPVACAAALAVIDIIEREHLLQNTLEQGAFLREEIKAFASPLISEVRAIGLMIGIQLNPDYTKLINEDIADTPPARHFVIELMKHGLLAVPAGDEVIRLLPPLNLKRAESKEAVQILKTTLEKCHASRR